MDRITRRFLHVVLIMCMFSQSACRANNAANGIPSDDTYDKDLEATGFGTKGYVEWEYSSGKKKMLHLKKLKKKRFIEKKD